MIQIFILRLILIASLLLPIYDAMAAPTKARSSTSNAPRRTQPKPPIKKQPKFIPQRRPNVSRKQAVNNAVATPVQGKAPSHPLKGFSGQCVGVLSGDTLIVADDNYEQVKIRLYGVDAPEPTQPFGPEATKEVQSLVFLKRVMIYNQGQDSDGTLLGWVFVPGKQGQICLNRELVRLGYAWWNKPAAPGEMMLGVTEAEAKGEKRGLWSQNEPVSPWVFRAQNMKP